MGGLPPVCCAPAPRRPDRHGARPQWDSATRRAICRVSRFPPRPRLGPGQARTRSRRPGIWPTTVTTGSPSRGPGVTPSRTSTRRAMISSRRGSELETALAEPATGSDRDSQSNSEPVTGSLSDSEPESDTPSQAGASTVAVSSITTNTITTILVAHSFKFMASCDRCAAPARSGGAGVTGTRCRSADFCLEVP